MNASPEMANALLVSIDAARRSVTITESSFLQFFMIPIPHFLELVRCFGG